MATLISKGPRVQQKPDNLLSLLQSRVSFNVEFSNSLITGQSLVDPSLRRTTLLQTYWLEPDENPVGGGSHHPTFPEDGGSGGESMLVMPDEPPIGGGSCHPIWPEDPSGGGENRPSFPEERDGKGGMLICFPTEPAAMGEDEPSFDVDDEVGSSLPAFPQEPIEDEAVPVYMALMQAFNSISPCGVQRLVEVPSFPPEDLGGGTEGPIYYFGGDGRHCPESPGGAGGDYAPIGLAFGDEDQGDGSHHLPKHLLAHLSFGGEGDEDGEGFHHPRQRGGIALLAHASFFGPKDGGVPCFGGDGHHCPEAPGGAGGDYALRRMTGV